MNRWMPFNAVCDGNILTDMIEKEKQYIKKPTLSTDQLENLQKKIVDSIDTNTTINLKYYNNGYFYYIQEKIKKLDLPNQKILFKNGKSLPFSCIIDAF